MILLDALELNPTPRRPVWLMRQAGRYMKSFRDLRARHSFIEICENAELIHEVTWQPLKAYQLDAAIVFYDILMPLRTMGYSLRFAEDGPIIQKPTQAQELDQFTGKDQVDRPHEALVTALKNLRADLPSDKALLGFSGAPFTLLAYWLEGKLSKDLGATKIWMAREPKRVHRCLDLLADYCGNYLERQVEAGANAVQLFDTWASVLNSQAYQEFALPYARKVLSRVTAPSIYYVNGVASILSDIANVGAQALGVDWRTSLSVVRSQVSSVTALQGNLDPYDLHLPPPLLRQRVFDMCEAYGRGPGHIVNLGHGMVPSIPEVAVTVFIDAVAEWSVSLR